MTKTTRIKSLVDDAYLSFLIDDFEKANKSIDVAMYVIGRWSTSASRVDRILKAIEDALERGVKVSVVLDGENSATTADGEEYSSNREAAARLKAAGCDVKMTTGPSMHSKVVVIDDEIVYIGAHNWTEAALVTNQEVSVRMTGTDASELKNWWQDMVRHGN